MKPSRAGAIRPALVTTTAPTVYAAGAFIQEGSNTLAEFDHDGFARKVKRFLSGVPLVTDVVAMYFCMLDPETPLWVKSIVASALGYFILPLDAIPDAIPFAGMSDDVAVFATTIKTVAKHLSAGHYEKARAWLAA
jgi:uncharacterized membrane protein YkvA (DUF1232 family)